jgi:GT2 family glycosyltransferase
MTPPSVRSDHLVRPRHVVTAVLIAHDGARWLPTTLHAVKTQRRPVQRFVAVDTGSRDDTRQLLEQGVGEASVLDAPRDVGFGAAAALAVQSFAGAPGLASTRSDAGAPIDWIWLLHDDSAPSPGALAALLELADEMPSVGIIGPKLRGWDNPRVLLELGVTVDRGGRRETGLEPGELDHGQHDGQGSRDALAVSTAGMLVRRDVWDDLGGFDPALPLFRDDLDFGWRANLAGHRVVPCAKAIVWHAEAASAGARRISSTSRYPRRVDRRAALRTMLVNMSGWWLPVTAMRLLIASLLRTLAFLITKRPADAWDELVATASVFGRPDVILRVRRSRRAKRIERAHEVQRLLAPHGARLRHYGESAAARFASVDDDDSGRGLFLRVVTQPALILTLALAVLALIAQWKVVGGTLSGGALLPAPVGASDLWHTYTANWHDTGFGSNTTAPPYLAALAVLATVLFGSARLAVQVLLIGCVPLAGLSAYLAAKPLTVSIRLRCWLAVAYALLPVATGTIAAGRIGTAAVVIVLPALLSLLCQALLPPLSSRARTMRLAARRAGRRIPGARTPWSAGLVLAVASAFDPIVYVMLAPVVLAASLAALARRAWWGIWRGLIVAVIPLLLLMPWSARVWHNPRLLAVGVGQQDPGLQAPKLPALDLLLMHPGGPGLPPAWLYVGVVLLGVLGLLQLTRPGPARLGWLLAGVGLVAGVAVSHVHATTLDAVTGATVTRVAGWPGSSTALIGAGLLMSAAAAGGRLRRRLAQANFGWRQPVALVLTAVGALTPVASAALWLDRGVGPILRAGSSSVLPAFVTAEAGSLDAPRTLALRPAADKGRAIEYALLRDRGPQLGDADLPPDPAQVGLLDGVVAQLAAGAGQNAALALAHAGIGYVLVPSTSDGGLNATIAAAGGLQQQSSNAAWRLWQVDTPAGRVAIAQAGRDSWLLPTGAVAVGAHAAPIQVPYAPATRSLVLAEAPSPKWQAVAVTGIGTGAAAAATGTPLAPTTVEGMQAFRLPASAVDVVIERLPDRRADWLVFELVVLAIAIIGAVPGGRRGQRSRARVSAPVEVERP